MLQVDLVGGVRGCIFASALLKRGPVGPPDGQAPGDGRFCVFSFFCGKKLWGMAKKIWWWSWGCVSLRSAFGNGAEMFFKSLTISVQVGFGVLQKSKKLLK